MNWKVTSEPVVELITLAEAKIWLKIDDYETENSLIESLIISARQSSESYCNRAFITQTCVMVFDAFEEFELMRSPVQSVTSITYEDSNGDSQTLSTDVYSLDVYAYPNRILLKKDQSWPSTSAVKSNVKVTYIAGYGDTASDVPNLIRDAIKVVIRDYYKNRDNPVRTFPTLAERMLDSYKIYRFV